MRFSKQTQSVVFKVWNHLEPEYFSMELGPLNVLKGLINEVLASDAVSYTHLTLPTILLV